MCGARYHSPIEDMAMTALRECPGCGTIGEDETGMSLAPHLDLIRMGPAPGKWFGRCMECGWEGPTHNTEAEATTAWNRRAPIDIEDRARDFVKFVLANGPHVRDAATMFEHLEWDELRAAFPELEGSTPDHRAPVSVAREEIAAAICGECSCHPLGKCETYETKVCIVAADAIIALLRAKGIEVTG